MTSTTTARGGPGNRKKKTHTTTLYTTTAPLELISLFYRMGREAKEESKSGLTLQLPDDTPIPDPVQKFNISRMGTADTYASSLCSPTRSVRESPFKYKSLKPSPMNNLAALDLETMDSSSWFFDDEFDELIVNSPSVLFHRSLVSFSDQHPEESFTFHKPSSLVSEARLQRRNRRRANSSDFAYAEANEASRINVAELRTPRQIEDFLSAEEKEEEDPPFLKLMKDQLSKGRPRVVASKPLLNNRLKRYERHKDKLSRVSWRNKGMSTGALTRASISEQPARAKSRTLSAEKGQWSIKVLPLSYFTSSESIEKEESKAELPRLTSHATSEK